MPPAPDEFIPRQQQYANVNEPVGKQDFNQETVLSRSLNDHLKERIKELESERDTQIRLFTEQATKYRTINDHCSDLLTTNQALRQNLADLMAEKDDLKNQIDVKDGQVAEFKKLSERVDVLTEENSSFQEQFNALKAKVEFYQRKIEKYGLQGEFKTSSNEDSVASSQQQDDF